MDRVLERDRSSDVTAMTMMLYSLPRMENRADALVVLPGLGEIWRTTDAIKTWDNGVSTARYLLLAGDNRNEKYWQHLTVEKLEEPPFKLNRHHTGGVLIREHSDNTADQAKWISTMVQELQIKSLAIFVSPYHLLRAYGTVLKAFLKPNSPVLIPLIPVPVAVPPNRLIPKNGAEAWDMVPGELARLKTYQEKKDDQGQGDVVTYHELRQYIDWLWTTPFMLNR